MNNDLLIAALRHELMPGVAEIVLTVEDLPRVAQIVRDAMQTERENQLVTLITKAESRIIDAILAVRTEIVSDVDADTK